MGIQTQEEGEKGPDLAAALQHGRTDVAWIAAEVMQNQLGHPLQKFSTHVGRVES